MTIYPQLERMRLYENEAGERSCYFLDILPKQLTVDMSYYLPSLEEHRRTLFREIRVAPILSSLSEADRDLFAIFPNTVEMSREDLVVAVAELLEDYIEKAWDPVKFHVVFHSSGIDSRVMSALIKRIYERRGAYWLGDVLFLCYGPEVAEFTKIMEYEGWSSSQYYGYLDVDVFFSRCLSFDRAWKWTNGTVKWAIGWYALEEMAPIPGDYQLWCGYGGGSGVSGCPDRVRLWRRFMNEYLGAGSTGQYKSKDVVYPFRSHDVLRTVVQSTTKLNESLSSAVLEHIDSTLLNEFENVRWFDEALVPIGVYLRAISDYDDSWYGRMKPLVSSTRRVIDNRGRWWSDWSNAALCQYLIKAGYELEAG